MSKAVMLSIRPRWCGLIAGGEKTIEVRKTRPKLDTPFKCYIYCTSGPKWCLKWSQRKVIGEFVCDGIYKSVYKVDYGMDEEGWYSEWDVNEDCLTDEEIDQYAGVETDVLYGWHISDLVIYDEPRELGEFVKPYDAQHCVLPTKPTCNNCDRCYIKRPPQSWCYVEELTWD